MAGPHQVAELGQRDGARRGGVAVGHAEGGDRHVAPVVFLGGAVLILRARQELERVDPQAPQVMAVPADPGGQLAVTAAHGIRAGQPQQVAQVAFHDHQVLDHRRRETIGQRTQVLRAEHDARGRGVLRLRTRPRIDDRALGEPALAGVVGAADRQGVIGPGQDCRHLADPGALPRRLERDEVVEPGLRPTPAHLDRAGPGGEHAEDGGVRADRRAEGTDRLEHIERVRGEDIAQFQFGGLGVDEAHRRRRGVHVHGEEAEEMPPGTRRRERQVAVTVVVAPDVVGVMRRLEPAAVGADELERHLGAVGGDVGERDRELEAFRALGRRTAGQDRQRPRSVRCPSR